MANGDWDKTEADRAKQKAQEIWNALSMPAQVQCHDAVTTLMAFLDEAKRQAPEEEP